MDITRDLSTGKKEIPNKSFGDLLEKYRDEVSAHKSGERWERSTKNQLDFHFEKTQN